MTGRWSKPRIYDSPAEVVEHTLVVVVCGHCRKPVLRVISIPERVPWVVPAHGARGDQPIGLYSEDQADTIEVACRECGKPRLVDTAELRSAAGLPRGLRPHRIETIHQT